MTIAIKSRHRTENIDIPRYAFSCQRAPSQDPSRCRELPHHSRKDPGFRKGGGGGRGDQGSYLPKLFKDFLVIFFSTAVPGISSRVTGKGRKRHLIKFDLSTNQSALIVGAGGKKRGERQVPPVVRKGADSEGGDSWGILISLSLVLAWATIEASMSFISAIPPSWIEIERDPPKNTNPPSLFFLPCPTSLHSYPVCRLISSRQCVSLDPRLWFDFVI